MKVEEEKRQEIDAVRMELDLEESLEKFRQQQLVGDTQCCITIMVRRCWKNVFKHVWIY
jgi:hypothetical protein